ncbi:unnamed protein product [Chrysoparadoxa australica]
MLKPRPRLLWKISTRWSTTGRAGATGTALYETPTAVSEYLEFHYASPSEILPYGVGPVEALNFPARCAKVCSEAVKVITQHGRCPDTLTITTISSQLQTKGRALDIGCAVGGASFQLARHFDQVVGVDYSEKFVEAANRMKEQGSMSYTSLIEGMITEQRTAFIPEGTNKLRQHIEFLQGDACQLQDVPLGEPFDVVLASNLLCRLPQPRVFLQSLKTLVKVGGAAVLISPYSWLKDYTDEAEWLGGYVDVDGYAQDSAQGVFRVMKEEGFELMRQQPMPFLIREHRRKFQWGCSDGMTFIRIF